MKEILDEESKNALINYRIQRAYETLKEAQVMMRESFYNAAVNRLYYACYYAAVSLLLKYDHQPQTHNGVKTMLGLHFISTGKLPIKIGKIFSTLFEKRHSGDYDDFVYCDKEMLDNLYPQAELFIHTINQLLKEEWFPKRTILRSTQLSRKRRIDRYTFAGLLRKGWIAEGARDCRGFLAYRAYLFRCRGTGGD